MGEYKSGKVCKYAKFPSLRSPQKFKLSKSRPMPTIFQRFQGFDGLSVFTKNKPNQLVSAEIGLYFCVYIAVKSKIKTIFRDCAQKSKPYETANH